MIAPLLEGAALSPVLFLERAAAVFPARTGVVDGERRWTWAQLAERARRLAAALHAARSARGERVAVLAPSSAELLVAHFGVPAAGAQLVAIDACVSEGDVAAILRRTGTRVLLVHAAHERAGRAAARRAGVARVLVGGPGAQSYEAFLAAAGPGAAPRPVDEDAVVCVTFGGPADGAVATHRGAYLDALAEVHHAGLDTRSVFLWDHAARRAFPWAVTAAGAKHVCLERADAATVQRTIEEERITHCHAAGDPASPWSAEEAAFRIARMPGPAGRGAAGGGAPAPAVAAPAAA